MCLKTKHDKEHLISPLKVPLTNFASKPPTTLKGSSIVASKKCPTWECNVFVIKTHTYTFYKQAKRSKEPLSVILFPKDLKILDNHQIRHGRRGPFYYCYICQALQKTGQANASSCQLPFEEWCNINSSDLFYAEATIKKRLDRLWLPVCTADFHYVTKKNYFHNSESELYSSCIATLVERHLPNPKVKGSSSGLGSYIFVAQNALIVPCT